MDYLSFLILWTLNKIKGTGKSKYRLVRVHRIIRYSINFKTMYVKCVVGYMYFVDGKGPYDIHMNPFKDPKKNTMADYLKWAFGGFLSSDGPYYDI